MKMGELALIINLHFESHSKIITKSNPTNNTRRDTRMSMSEGIHIYNEREISLMFFVLLKKKSMLIHAFKSFDRIFNSSIETSFLLFN